VLCFSSVAWPARAKPLTPLWRLPHRAGAEDRRKSRFTEAQIVGMVTAQGEG
jgi:hypothetical protein